MSRLKLRMLKLKGDSIAECLLYVMFEIAVTFIIKVEVVVAEDVRQPHASRLYRVVDKVGTAHYALAKPQREFGRQR